MDKIDKWRNIVAYQKEQFDSLSFITLTKSNLQSEAEEMPWISDNRLIEICEKIEKTNWNKVQNPLVTTFMTGNIDM